MPLKIYYVDDEPDLLELFCDIFSSPKVEITTFSNPDEALRTIKQNPPDLLILDHRLPQITGEQLALQVDPSIPKALITGEVNLQPSVRFEAVFEKPFSIDAVRAFIDSHIQTLGQ